MPFRYSSHFIRWVIAVRAMAWLTAFCTVLTAIYMIREWPEHVPALIVAFVGVSNLCFSSMTTGVADAGFVHRPCWP